MDAFLKFQSVSIGMVLHNEPLPEAMVIAPPLLKKYVWALLVCLLVALGAFGAKLHNNYDRAVRLSVENLAILPAQIGIAVLAPAAIFLLKLQLRPVLGLGGSKTPKGNVESTK